MQTLESVIADLHTLAPEMLARTREWVLINSYTENVRGVNEVGQRLAEAFRLPGLSLHMQPGGAGSGDHLVWSTAASAGARPLLILGHHDTVFPEGHFEGWHEEAGRVRAAGSLDMKGGLAVVWGALQVLSAAGVLPRLPLIVASVADEETGSLDSKAHLEQLARRASAALVFEAGRERDQIITSRRGVGTLRVVATGKAAHAGNAHAQGANAIHALARFIIFAESQTDYARGVTVNTGTITGGTSANTVPAHAEARVDLRFDRVADAEALIACLRAEAGQVSVSGTTLRLEGGIKRLPMERTPESLRLYEAYAECQRQAGLGSGEHPLVGGGSDANTVAGVGLPAIDGLGPRGNGFHTTSEYIEVDSLVPKAEALLRFLWQHVTG